MISERNKEPVLDPKELYTSSLLLSLVMQTLHCDLQCRSAPDTHCKPQTESPSGEGLLVCCLVYLSNETATPSRDVKKKKKEDAAIRPLLIV